MKELFSMDDIGIVSVVEEGSVYGVYDVSKKCWRYFDNLGQELLQYEREKEEENMDYDQYTDDPTQVTPLVEGFYGYTTHEVEYDPDGMYGYFGIKDKDGNKITEEIFSGIDCFSNGLCPVRNAEGKWGCVDESGELVIPYKFFEGPQFNEYGVAEGDDCLIDRNGEEIPDTNLDYVDDCDNTNRYFTFSMLSAEQSEAINDRETEDDIRLNVYDTKLRKYILKDIPEFKLDVSWFEGEAEVILAASELMEDFDEIRLKGKGTIIAKKGGKVTLFDYYQSVV